MTTDRKASLPRRRRVLSDDEQRLWAAVVRFAKPLRGRNRPALAASADAEAVKPSPPPVAASANESRSQPPRSAPVPALAPLPRRDRQRLVRGTLEFDARIDLHGMTQAEAYAALSYFLSAAQRRGAKLVLVITGKGGVRERGVLRRQVPLWLKLYPFRPYVVGYETAHASHGGEGALYIRVRRRPA